MHHACCDTIPGHELHIYVVTASQFRLKDEILDPQLSFTLLYPMDR